MKNSNFFKDSFNLKQCTAFCLTFNWAYSQYDKMCKTNHFRQIYKENKNHISESVIEKFRNYFSHYTHKLPALDDKDIKSNLEYLIREAIAKLKSRHPKLDNNEDKEIWEILNKINDDPFNFFPVSDDNKTQPALALLLSPFVTKSQISFLQGKFFRGPNITADSTQHLAIKRILETLSQSNRVLREEHNLLFSDKKEMGMAVWTRLINNITENNTISDNFPEDEWFMRQLILCLEHTDTLPSVKFARVDTVEDTENNKLQREIIFTEDKEQRKKPLVIQLNTIEVKINIENQEHRTVFGIHTLKYLTALALSGKPINDFIVNWHKRHLKRGTNPIAKDISKEVVEKRIDYFLNKYSGWDKNTKLYQQIQFICSFINRAWEVKNDQYMSSGMFKNFQQKVRHYRQKELQQALQEKKLNDVTQIGLGKQDNQPLGRFFTKERLQEVFVYIVRSHRDWLKQKRSQISSLSEKKIQKLAIYLKVKGAITATESSQFALKKESSKTNKGFFNSVALSSKDIREKFFRNEQDCKNKISFFNIIKELSGNTIIPFDELKINTNSKQGAKPSQEKINNKDAEKIKKEKWARIHLLFKLALKLIQSDSTHSVDNISKISALSKLEMVEKLNEVINIKYTLSQSWRHYADFEKDKIQKLVQAYYPDFQKGQSIPLLAPSGKSKTPSIQSLKKEVDRERFLLMQAILEWEKTIIVDQNLSADSGKDYIPFEEVLQKADIDSSQHNELLKIRNCCMHEDIWKRAFSETPEPFKMIYKKLKEKQTMTRTEKTGKAKKRYNVYKKHRN